METRELLEAAARAAGIEIVGYADRLLVLPNHDGSCIVRHPSGGDVEWNPLADDGDALRLAIDLRMQIDISIDGCRIYLSTSEKPIAGCSYSEVRDLYAATRLAIVRAAAAIDAQRRET